MVSSVTISNTANQAQATQQAQQQQQNQPIRDPEEELGDNEIQRTRDASPSQVQESDNDDGDGSQEARRGSIVDISV